MRIVRLALYFVIGILLGGGSVVAWAGPEAYGRSMNINAAPSNVGAARPGWYSNPTYDFPDAPNGWGKMRDLNRMSVGGKLIELQGWRNFAPRALAGAGVALARVGPLAIGMTLAPLIWDEAQGWLKEQEPEPGQTEEPQGVFSNLLCSTGGHRTPRDACLATNVCAGTAWPGTYQWTGQVGAFVKCYRADGTLHPSAVRAGVVCPTGWTYNGSACVEGAQQEPPRPATAAEIEDAIYTELVARGMGSELARRLIQAGYHPTPESVGAQGPGSVAGPTSTTTETITVDRGNGTGTQTTSTTTTHNISYTTNTTNTTVTVTTTTITNITHPNGTQTTTETETVPPPTEEGEEPYDEQYTLDYQGSSMPEVPDFYEQQYPDGFAGEWDKFKGKIGASPLAGFLEGLSSGLPGGGTCPEWGVSLNFGQMGNFGTHVIAPPCAIWPFVKAVMILSALFVARRMVFGG